MPLSPAPSPSAIEHTTTKPPPVKAAGAYRPPGARGLAAPSIFKREDEGGAPQSRVNGNGYGNGNSNGRYVPGAPQHAHSNSNGGGTQRRRPNIPGAPPPGAPPAAGESGEKKAKQKRKKKDQRGGDDERKQNGMETPPAAAGTPTPVTPPVAPPAADSVPPTPAAESGSLDPIAKKIRNLNKKVGTPSNLKRSNRMLTAHSEPQIKAIEELKEKTKRGERLEATQLKKIDTEAEIRKELAGLVSLSNSPVVAA